MSRRQRLRSGHDKRTTALELARAFGHGTPMPCDEGELDDERDYGTDPPVPDHRTPIGPTDCKPLNSESRT